MLICGKPSFFVGLKRGLAWLALGGALLLTALVAYNQVPFILASGGFNMNTFLGLYGIAV